MLPRALCLRLTQIIGCQRGSIPSFIRCNLFHCGQCHAGGSLLAQMLRKQLQRQVIILQRIKNKLRTVSNELNRAGNRLQFLRQL